MKLPFKTLYNEHCLHNPIAIANDIVIAKIMIIGITLWLSTDITLWLSMVSTVPLETRFPISLVVPLLPLFSLGAGPPAKPFF